MSRLSEFKSSNSEKVTQANIQEKYNEFKDMSKDQLNERLFTEVARQKREGSFDYASLERMVESLRGSLSESEFQNIKRLLESLK